jgi:hypothetical protein
MHEELKLYVERRWRHIKRKKDRGIRECGEKVNGQGRMGKRRWNVN